MFQNRVTHFLPILNLQGYLTSINFPCYFVSSFDTLDGGEPIGRLFYDFLNLCQSLTPAKETDRND